MKVIIVSDSHGNETNIDRILEIEGTPDILIHLGDVCGGEDYIRAVCDCEVFMVSGNNDWYSRDLPNETVVEIGNKRALLTHGHYYGLRAPYDDLVRRAKQENVDIIMFGHTHVPVYLNVDDIIVLNPGSVTYPRQKGHQYSYMVMEDSASESFTYQLKYL